MYIRVSVVPDAKRERVTQEGEARFHVEVKEPRERNMANKRIREIVARECAIPVEEIRIVSGHRSPRKVINIG